MTQRFEIHPTHPQKRLVQQAAEILRKGGVVVLPTDACYVLACPLADKTAVDRLRAVLDGREPDANALDYPKIDDGIRGMAFIEAAVESSKNNARWTALPS